MSRTRNGPRDAGLQAERTALAWNRTALAILVNALIALRTAWANGGTLMPMLAVALLLCAVAAAGCGLWRRGVLLGTAPDIAPPALVIAAVSFAVWLACAAAFASLTATS